MQTTHTRAAKRFRFIAAAAALSVASSAHAQPTPEQLMRGVFEAVRQSQQPQQGYPGQQSGIPAGASRSATRLLEPPAQPLWANKEAFLAYASAGRLLDFLGNSGPEASEFDRNIYAVLVRSFGIPLIPEDCRAYLHASTAIGQINRAYADGLTDRPPHFTGMGFDTQHAAMQADQGRHTLRGGLGCTGRGVRLPYQEALLQLSVEYERAVAGYITTERSRRVEQYRTAQTNARQQEQQRQATARAEEQERIDAEAARIRAAEQQRRQKDRARLGG